MKALLETRMMGGEPPDSFQVHLGRELIDSHVIADRMEPLDFLYEEAGLYETFPQDLVDIASYEGIPIPCRSTSTARTTCGIDRAKWLRLVWKSRRRHGTSSSRWRSC